MPKLKIISWNVNGLRAILKKGFAKFVDEQSAEVFCIQETKTNQELELNLPGYRKFWSCGERAGYSGVLTLVKDGLDSVPFEIDAKYELLHLEGRVMATTLSDFILFNVYFPNGGQGPERLAYKMKFYEQFLQMTKELLAQGKKVVVCGDVNTAHHEIDLARPKANEKNTGFLPAERAWVTDYLATGMVDVWRKLHPEQVGYSWWDYKTRARERNVGWRIDYFLVSDNLFKKVVECEILEAVMGSDHAPVELVILNTIGC